MGESKTLYAVITGDVVSSSSLTAAKRRELLEGLKESFSLLDKIFPQKVVAAPFEIYRGDSFQGVLKAPQYALRVNLFIRARLRQLFSTTTENALDARMAIGIGEIEYFSRKGTEGDGTAYRLSGPVLDHMKGETMLAINTPEDRINQEMEVACALTDFVISKWSAARAEVIEQVLRGKKQQTIADALNITQGAVNQRLKSAGWHGLEKFLERFEAISGEMIPNQIKA